jgi:iron complex outermembrane recepter protein
MVRFFPRNRVSVAVTLAVTTFLAGSSLTSVAQAAGASSLEEVLVTASKRVQTLQDTPIAVSVVSEQMIEQSAIIGLSDLQVLVPALRVSTTSRVGSVTYTIRGFGNGGNTSGTEPSVGVFVDGVFRSRSSATVSDLPRLERIEVLSGPQSTLFGKNASAGVISVVTAPPSREFDAKVEATVGNYDQRILKAYATGAVSDTWALSASGSVNQRDGFTEALNPQLDDLNDKDRFSVRGQALWEPTDKVLVRFMADYTDIDEICCTAGAVYNAPGPSDAIRALGGELVDDQDAFSYTSVLNVNPENKIQDQGVSLHVDVDFDNFTLTSLTAYRENESGPNRSEGDYSSLDFIQGVSSREIDTFSQEFRLTSTTDGPLQWMAGAFLFDEDINTNLNSNFGDDLRDYILEVLGPASAALGVLENIAGIPGESFAPGVQVNEASSQEDTYYSIFGTLDYEFADAFTATVGLNYAESEKEASVNQYENQDAFSALDLDVLAGGVFSPVKGLQFRPPNLNYPNAVEDGESSDSETTWLARLAWAANDDINFYISASTGWKPSSWDLSSFGNPVSSLAGAIDDAGIATPNQQYGSRLSDSEYTTLYEIGMKSSFEKGTFNVAIFDQTIEDFQTRAFDGVNFINTNADEMTVQGVDLELAYEPTSNWLLTLGAIYLDPEYTKYENALAPASEGVAIVDRSGTRPGGIHEVSATATVTYNMSFSNGISGYIRGEYLYESETELSDSFPEYDREVNTANASAGLEFGNGFAAQLWVRNINEDEYFTGAFSGVAQTGTVNSFLNQPRTYGVTASYRFK